jgi:hypothetical protein
MRDTLVVVDGYAATDRDGTDLSSLREAMGFALDQRAFGPRRLLVVFTEADGRLRHIAHTKRIDPIEPALLGCLQHLGRGAAAAVVFNDERVVEGPIPIEQVNRFQAARLVFGFHGIHLVDWFACDDDMFRSTRLAAEEPGEWWDVPVG